MISRRRVGVFGGTFDPIHRGHIDIGTAAQHALGLSELLVIPASVPPHRANPQASAYHRFAMVALTVAGRTGWRASDIELQAGGPSYTSATLDELHERGYMATELYFVVGADAFADIGAWKDYPGILDRAHFAVVSRPGCGVSGLGARLPGLAERMVEPPIEQAAGPAVILIDAVTADVSSTAVRERCARGQSIAGMVDDAVRQHIERHALYTAVTPGRRDSGHESSPAAGRLNG
jgi:nicotinate-nucleotide adenylyltransferase